MYRRSPMLDRIIREEEIRLALRTFFDAITVVVAIIIAIAILSSGCARADDALSDYAWTKTDTALELTHAAVRSVDFMQTLTIARSPDRHSELNPILGRHPSTSAVVTWFTAGELLHLGVARLLPHELRRAWQIGTIAGSVAAIGWNIHAGIKIDL